MALFSDSKLTGRVAALESSLSELSEGQKKILSLLEAKAKAKPDKEDEEPGKDAVKKKAPAVKPDEETEDSDQAENDSDPVADDAGSEPDQAGKPESDPVDAEGEGSGDEEPEPGDQDETDETDFSEGETSAEEEDDEANESPEEDGNKSDEETEEEGKEDVKKGKKKAAVSKSPRLFVPKADSVASLKGKVADLERQLSALSQKGLAAAAANIGIKPIARVESTEGPDIADPTARTKHNWSQPINGKSYGRVRH
jgi:hypothetical protein